MLAGLTPTWDSQLDISHRLKTSANFSPVKCFPFSVRNFSSSFCIFGKLMHTSTRISFKMNSFFCPSVGCNVTTWTEWAACWNSEKKRTRTTIHGDHCKALKEAGECTEENCPGLKIIVCGQVGQSVSC